MWCFLLVRSTVLAEMRMTFWNRVTRDNEETTQCGWLTVSGRDIFISSHWGAALTGYRTPFSQFIGTHSSRFAGFFDVHILKGPPGLFSNPEVKLERVYGVVTWETSGEMYMTSNFLFWGFNIFGPLGLISSFMIALLNFRCWVARIYESELSVRRQVRFVFKLNEWSSLIATFICRHLRIQWWFNPMWTEQHVLSVWISES